MKPTITKITTAVTDALDWATNKLTVARDAISELLAAERALREQHTAVSGERVAIQSAPPPLAEVLAEMDKDLERLRRQWLEFHGHSLLSALSPAMDPSGTTSRRAVTLEEVLHVDLGMLIALAPTAIREGLTAALPVFESGPPMAERPARLAALDARILDLETQHAQLVDQAASAGIQLPHLEATISRRHIAARAQQKIADYNAANAGLIRQGRVKPAETIEEAK